MDRLAQYWNFKKLVSWQNWQLLGTRGLLGVPAANTW